MWARALTGRISRVGTSISARSVRNSPATMYQTSTGIPAFFAAIASWNTRRSAPPRRRPLTAMATAVGEAWPRPQASRATSAIGRNLGAEGSDLSSLSR